MLVYRARAAALNASIAWSQRVPRVGWMMIGWSG
jgi:hypothetical protein